MSTLAVIAYPDQGSAGEAVAALRQGQTTYLIELRDIAWVTKPQDGAMELHQGTRLLGAGAAGSAMWGFLFAWLVRDPRAGMAGGAASDALGGEVDGDGLDDTWLTKVSRAILPGGSALFVMARTTTAERALPEMAKFGGTVHKTTLTPRQQRALEAARQLPA